MTSSALKLHIFNNLDEFIDKSVSEIEAFVTEQLKDQKIVRIALSGGKSPIPVYIKLTESKNIPWSRVTLFLVDERYVPLNSEDSNFRMINENLASNVKNLRKFYHYNTRDPITTIVDQYQKALDQFESPLFDLIILGLGADGHTASLFPNSPALHEKNRLVVHTQSADGMDRMSLTFPAILDCKKIIFLIQGADKKDIVDKWSAQKATADELPAIRIFEHPNVEAFYCH